MKKRILKVIGGLSLIMLTLVTLAQVWVSAQTNTGNGLVGSWDVAVTARDCETGDPIPFLPTFFAMQTYNHGGTMLANNLGAPGIVSVGAHGVWEHQKGRQYSVAFRYLQYDPSGTFVGRNVIRDVITLDVGRASYTSTGGIDILDPNGNLILRGCATSTATRFE